MMSDTKKIIESERGRFKLDVWETNKGPSLGYARWCVYASVRWEPGETPFWFPLEHQRGDWTSFDNADRDGAYALDYWSKNFNAETWDDTPLPDGSQER